MWFAMMLSWVYADSELGAHTKGLWDLLWMGAPCSPDNLPYLFWFWLPNSFLKRYLDLLDSRVFCCGLLGLLSEFPKIMGTNIGPK